MEIDGGKAGQAQALHRSPLSHPRGPQQRINERDARSCSRSRHPDLPADPERYSRVIEIVNQAPELLTICREHFRQYRQRGYAPQRVEL